MSMIGRVRAFFSARPQTFDRPVRAQFSDPIFPIDQLLLYAQAKVGLIDRPRALQVPEVLRGRNMICSIATLPLQAVDASNVVQDSPLLEQFDPNVPNVVTVAQILEDLLFDSVSWLRITGFSSLDGMPAQVQRYAPEQVSLTPPRDYMRGYLPSGLPSEVSADARDTPAGRYVWMGGVPVPWDEVIRFDSPNPALLIAGQRAICRAIALDDAAELYAANPQARGYFTPADPSADPGDDSKIIAALDAWEEARRERVDGYVPAAVKYNTIQNPTPVELQLVEMQRRAALALANALGIDPEDLGISTTSRTYQNATDRRQDRVNDVLAPYMRAVTDRLSMPDVTRPGVTVRFSLRDFLRADPLTRAQVQQIYSQLGATDAAEIRDDEGEPPRAITPPAPIVSTTPPRALTAAGRPRLELAADAAAEFTFDLTNVGVDGTRRTISGLVIPYGKVARSRSRRWRFAPGSANFTDLRRVKLLRDHDNAQLLGKAIDFREDAAGVHMTFRISAGPRGDEALAMAADGTLDGLSVGADFIDDVDTEPDPENPGVGLIHRYDMREVSLTGVPSFDDSRVTSVRASRDGSGTVNCPTCGQPIVEGVAHTCATPATVPTPTPPAAPAAQPVTFTPDQLTAFAAQVVAGMAPPAAVPPVRPVVDPTRTPPAGPAQVVEPLPYRFAYEAGRHVFRSDAEHDFSTDLFATMDPRTPAADRVASELRVNSMIQAQFASVDRAGVTDSTVPHQYRPDMWQAQMDYATPLWEMVAAGTTDGTKFDIPKFSSSSGLVGPATEGTEPTPGAFAATLQTITPTQVWGKVNITRQAWRAGGNPALSGILWDQMLREYYEDREAAVATFLATLTAAADITLTGTPATTPDNDDDQVTVGDFSRAVADLGFVRGGNRFRAFAVQQDLFRVFSRVTDDAGRPLFPIINPSNANGTSQPLFSYIDVAGVRLVGSWALGAAGQTTAQNSWLFDPAKVLGWASAPERLFWDFGSLISVDGNAGTVNLPQLKEVTLGIYGDVAFGNTDINGVRQVIFDPSV